MDSKEKVLLIAVSGLLLLLVSSFVFSVVEVDATVTLPQVPDQPLPSGQSVVYYLKMLNSKIFGESIAVVNGGSTGTGTNSGQGSTGGVEVDSTQSRTYKWTFNDDVVPKKIIFPDVSINGSNKHLAVYLRRDSFAGIVVLADVIVNNKVLNCFEDKTFVEGFVSSAPFSSSLNLSYNNTVTCGVKLNNIPIVSLNLNRFSESGKDELVIVSPLIPNESCKVDMYVSAAETETGTMIDNYLIEC